jgi:uncharacterized protein (DUF1330 family)
MERIEGDRELPTMFVVVEWPPRDAFHEFHHDPKYQDVKQLRHDLSDESFVGPVGIEPTTERL